MNDTAAAQFAQHEELKNRVKGSRGGYVIDPMISWWKGLAQTGKGYILGQAHIMDSLRKRAEAVYLNQGPKSLMGAAAAGYLAMDGLANRIKDFLNKRRGGATPPPLPKTPRDPSALVVRGDRSSMFKGNPPDPNGPTQAAIPSMQESGPMTLRREAIFVNEEVGPDGKRIRKVAIFREYEDPSNPQNPQRKGIVGGRAANMLSAFRDGGDRADRNSPQPGGRLSKLRDNAVEVRKGYLEIPAQTVSETPVNQPPSKWRTPSHGTFDRGTPPTISHALPENVRTYAN
jgi:hypothetical protein